MPEAKSVLNRWVLLGALVVASLMTICTLGTLWLLRPSASNLVPSTAVLYVIPAPPASATPASEAGEGPLPTPPAGEIQTGAFVQVTGTGGAGLRLRDQPGLAGKMLLLGSEAEVFRVDDGPRELDGYTWWYLVGPFDDQRRGWAVSNYLQVVQNP